MFNRVVAGIFLLALPFFAFAWDCNTDLLQGISYSYRDDLSFSCSYTDPSSSYHYFCLFTHPSQGNSFRCSKYIYNDGEEVSYPLSSSNPVDRSFLGSCLYLSERCGCSCDLDAFSHVFGSFDGSFSSGGSSGGSGSSGDCRRLTDLSDLLLGIKQGVLRIFIASSFLFGLASAGVSIVRVKGWI